jgi:hypothetical protein
MIAVVELADGAVTGVSLFSDKDKAYEHAVAAAMENGIEEARAREWLEEGYVYSGSPGNGYRIEILAGEVIA